MSRTEKAAMRLQPYLFFDGRAEEAIAFYTQALGAELLALMRFRDSPAPPQEGTMPPGSEDKVMHAALRIGETELMLSDGHCTGAAAFRGVSLALTVTGEAEADRCFAALAKGGQVQMPIGATFFSPRFGMVADRFGVAWMVMAAPPS